MNIYVSNLGLQTSNEDLKNLFSGIGQVTSANVIMDKYSGASRGFAFVEMRDEAEGNKAIKDLNNSQLGGKFISVSIARVREERNNANSNKSW